MRQFTLVTVLWGIVGMTVGVLLAAQLLWPVLNFDTPWLTYRRLRPLHTNAVIFAFGGCALFATSYRVVQRTCRAPLFAPRLAAFTFWGWQAVIAAVWVAYGGAVDAMVQWWYGHNAVGFFLTAGFLGMMYYFVPKQAGRPIYSYRLSIVHFWALISVYMWAGPHHVHSGALGWVAMIWLSTAATALILLGTLSTWHAWTAPDSGGLWCRTAAAGSRS